MSDSEAKTDVEVEQKVADVTAVEGNGTTCTEPPSELEQKIIKQVEVSNCELIMCYWSHSDCLQYDSCDRFNNAVILNNLLLTWTFVVSF